MFDKPFPLTYSTYTIILVARQLFSMHKLQIIFTMQNMDVFVQGKYLSLMRVVSAGEATTRMLMQHTPRNTEKTYRPQMFSFENSIKYLVKGILNKMQHLIYGGSPSDRRVIQTTSQLGLYPRVADLLHK